MLRDYVIFIKLRLHSYINLFFIIINSSFVVKSQVRCLLTVVYLCGSDDHIINEELDHEGGHGRIISTFEADCELEDENSVFVDAEWEDYSSELGTFDFNVGRIDLEVGCKQIRLSYC